MSLTIRDMFERLGPLAQQALTDATSLSASQGGAAISPAHVLHEATQIAGSDLVQIFAHLGLNRDYMRQAFADDFVNLPAKPGARPSFSGNLQSWLGDAVTLNAVKLGGGPVTTGALFLALLGNLGEYGNAAIARLVKSVNQDRLIRDFDTIVEGSVEQEASGTGGSGDGKQAQKAVKAARAEKAADEAGEALERFCTDFTALANEGKIDPIFCRDSEIDQCIDILARRRKNNPIAVGEPGVGKTALVEGLALRIAQGDVPLFLKECTLLGLDLGALQAGASVRGEFEKRLKAVLDGLKSDPREFVLFIDEAHTLIGAGNAAGGGDAANLLKPALARGDLRCIAATTWSEYKKYFEKDPALARRFQLVNLPAPSVAQSVVILEGLAAKYEAAHGVHIAHEGLVAAATLSDRYISGRQLPDKAIDVLDTAAGRVKTLLQGPPRALERLNRDVEMHKRQREHIARDGKALGTLTSPDVARRLAEIDQKIAEAEADRAKIEAQTASYRSAVDAYVAARQRCLDAPQSADDDQDNNTAVTEAVEAGSTSDGGMCDDTSTDGCPGVSANSASDDGAGLAAALAAIRDQELPDLIPYQVGASEIAAVISEWTGVPLGSLQSETATKVLSLDAALGASIKGQDYAIEALAKGIKASVAGTKRPNTPTGAFLFLGSSGVGKTELARTLADQMYGGSAFLTIINMSEYQEAHTISRLIGSPPGYVGYGEGGVLSEAIRQTPYQVVLLDEIEKADPEVLNLFYQAFDHGEFADGEGRVINCRNICFVLTSNLCTDILVAWSEAWAQYQATKDEEDEEKRAPKPLELEQLQPALHAELVKHMKPALLGRMEIVPFVPLGADTVREIVELKTQAVSQRVTHTHGIDVLWTAEALDAIRDASVSSSTGARAIDHLLERSIMPPITDILLGQMQAHSDAPSPGDEALGALTVGYGGDGNPGFWVEQ